jgi:hypothetical protein
MRGSQESDNDPRSRILVQSEVTWNDPTTRDAGGENPDDERQMRITLFQIKLVHTLVFWVLSWCVVYALLTGLADRITVWTWVAVGLVLVESVVLAVSGWTCPLTILAERRGALRGSVSDIFLPRWFADRIFPICGTLYVVALVAIAWRMVS